MSTRANRNYLPKNVIIAKLKRSKKSMMQINDGIVVTKWRDKQDVRMLSTKTSELKTTSSRINRPITKPECISEYNHAKSSIDLNLNHQMATNGSALRRYTKCYTKLPF